MHNIRSNKFITQLLLFEQKKKKVKLSFDTIKELKVIVLHVSNVNKIRLLASLLWSYKPTVLFQTINH